ncbi:MAG: hypothetical protein DI539_15260 [Flavobacterium psychrophilum]|nr:MAG: hypothetical protein DI539_15260 [Flavobacterium psychrophilum]
MGNSLTQDSSLDPNEAIHFSNVDEFKVWANDLDKQFDGEIEVPNIKLTSGDCGDGMYTGSIGAGFGTLYFNVTVAGGKVTGVGSTYGGWHLGTTWSQGSFVQKGNKVIVTGSFNYNLLLVDDSCFYTQYVTFVITLPC